MAPLRQILRPCAWLTGTATGYWLLARFGLYVAPPPYYVAAFWPAAGLALFAAFHGRAPALLGVALGAFAAVTTAAAHHWGIAAGAAIGAAASGWLGASTVRRLRDMRPLGWLEPQRQNLALVAAAVIAPVVSTAMGLAVLILPGAKADADFVRLGRLWWSADVLGILLMAPALFAVEQTLRDRAGWTARRTGRGLLAAAAVLGLCAVAHLTQPGIYIIVLLLAPLLVAFTLAGETGLKLAALASAVLFTLGGYEGSRIPLQPFLVMLIGVSLLLASLRAPRPLFWPILVLLFGWLAGGWLFNSLERKQDTFDRYRLGQVIEDVQDDLVRRMETYVDALRGGASMLGLTGNITREEWRRYTSTLQLFERYPGVHGVGVVKPVRPGDVPAHEKEMQTQHPGYRTRRVPSVTRPPMDPAGYEHFFIALVEPVEPNALALGLDLASEANRQEAAMHARDTGQAHVTRRIQLVQDNVSRPGFLLFLPVFRGPRIPTTIAERRERFVCWIYAPFVMQEFVEGVLGHRELDLDFFMFEGNSTAPADLLYATGGRAATDVPREFFAVTRLEMAQETYTLGWVLKPAAVQRDHLPAVLAATGLALATVLLAGLVLSLQGFVERANALTAARTRELETSNRSLLTAQQQLRAQEAEARKLALIAARTVNAVVLTDAAGYIEWVNEGFTRMTGYTFAEARGRKPGLLLQGRDTDPATVAQFRELLRLEQGFMIEILNYTKAGQARWLHIEVQPIRDESGRVVNYMGIETDITERRSAQQALEQARQRAEEASRAKSVFLRNISHELRTPLNVVTGSLQFLTEGRYGPVSAPQRRVLQSARDNSRHLLSLINDLLDLTRAESGQLRLEPGAVDVTRLCTDCVELLASAAAAGQLELKRHCRHFTPLIEGDPLRLRQVLINLLGNAVKFTPPGGTITLETDEDPASNTLTLAVSDTGPGIAPEHQERIFQEFERIEDSSQPAAAGTGLGLPIARRLAELHGGSLELEGRVGAGSRFIVRLPVRAVAKVPSAAAPAAAAPAAAGKASHRILAVEDYPANLELLCSYLEMEGHEVLQAGNGPDAIALATEKLPDLILMDVKMPGIDGLEATRRLKADPRTSHIPVVSLTAFAGGSDQAACLAAGAVGFLTKPIDYSQLDTVIARHALKRA